MSRHQPRKWQADAFKKIDRIIKSGGHEVVPVNACVGSGKTDLACYSYGKFICEHRAQKTVQVFVSPRIKLCSQQEDSIEGYIDDTFGLKHDVDYKVLSINCTDSEFNRKSGELNSQHAVFVFCEASLWGVDEDATGDKEHRWHRWLHNFKKWSEENGYLLGSIFYDEAHNYENQKDKIASLTDIFNLTLLASGTPSWFQKELTKVWKKNECACSPAEAMELKMICKPSLNMVRGSIDTDFPNAIAAVLKRETTLCKSEVFTPCILVNCSGIDQIKSILEHKWFNGKIGKELHTLTIHCSKTYIEKDEDGDKVKKVFDSSIDGNPKTSGEVYDVIEKLDDGYFHDTLPILVFQVGMIGEGINVKCFNSVITTTHTDRTAMQQIGRAIRNCEKNGKTKIEDGHASVYAFFENVAELQQLIVNLQSYDLTDSCFSWGKLVDVSTGSGITHNPENDTESELNEFPWDDFSDLDIQEIIRAADIKCTKIYRNEFVDELLTKNPELVRDFMKAISSPKYVEEFGGCKSFSEREFEREVHEKNAQREVVKSDKVHEPKKRDPKAKQMKASSDKIIEHLLLLKKYASSHKGIFQKLFTGDNKAKFLTKVFGSNLVGDFFAKVINDKILKQISK